MTDLTTVLAFFASTAGAGWGAQRLFVWLRALVACPTTAAWQAGSPVQRLLWRLIWAPRWARYVVFGLSALIAVAAAGLGAALTDRAFSPALDAALAAVVSQLVHAGKLPARVEGVAK